MTDRGPFVGLSKCVYGNGWASWFETLLLFMFSIKLIRNVISQAIKI